MNHKLSLNSSTYFSKLNATNNLNITYAIDWTFLPKDKSFLVSFRFITNRYNFGATPTNNRQFLVNANLGLTIKNLEDTIGNINNVLDGLENGEGTLGKLLKDDEMYTNLTNASKELEELLNEMKLNPKRFVHFSLFGKKDKGYNPEQEQ